ncbi:MAG: hypothetical protein K1X55_18245 [Chitinophagales bacterium]|nr:hypothetical protein [Chitinophagales bacterium]
MTELIVKVGRKINGYFKNNPKNDRLDPNKFNKKILTAEKGNDLIKSLLYSQQPCMITRYGNVELNTIINYLEIKELKEKNRISKLYSEINWKNKDWSLGTLMTIKNNAGVFPASPEILTAFSEIYIKDSGIIDALGVWYNYGENIMHSSYFPNADLFPLLSIEPYYFESPWSECLLNKKVLVIHPFSKSIEKQFNNKMNLFKNPNILPEFELITLKAHQSNAGNEINFDTWIEALEDLKDKINQTNFDIALIGAGAYGLPLAAHVKRMGKQAIHFGGSLQILFGIKGTRWDANPEVNKFYNKYWVRPLPEETPIEFRSVEGGCYW